MRGRRTPRPDPHAYAGTLGIEVVKQPLEGVNGLWISEHRLVVLNVGMSEVKERCTLAHELAHAVLGHADSSPLHEWQADRYAATHMVCREDFLYWWPRCLTLDDLAFELQVTKKLALAYVGLVAPNSLPPPEDEEWPTLARSAV